MMAAGSFHATRTTGTVSVCETAWSIGQRLAMSVRPCCMSTTSASNPWRAMTSAVNPLDTDSQPMVTHLLSRHICLILFARIIAPRSCGVAGLPARGRSVSQAPGPALC
jgi:hypothetical protein